MPAYTPNRIMLLVDDMPACVAFYRDVLGFTPAVLVEGDIYAEFDTGSVRISLYGREMLAGLIGTQDLPIPTPGQDRLLVSIAVEDIDAAYRDLTAQGVTFVTPPTDRPVWALRTAHFRDPDGNLIEINQHIPMSG